MDTTILGLLYFNTFPSCHLSISKKLGSCGKKNPLLHVTPEGLLLLITFPKTTESPQKQVESG